jgi:hypothetical protein
MKREDITRMIAACTIVLFTVSAAVVQEPRSQPAPASIASDAAASAAAQKNRPAPKLPEPKDAQRLSPQYDVWIDTKQKAVLIDGQISLREGMLEMFACTKNTKEHESIVSANTKAFLVHAALLRLGAEPGRPVQFVPEYKPPTGTEIDVLVYWIDPAGKAHTARAQKWIKEIRTGKEMTHPWVFAGSRFWKDAETGKQYYQAEGGDFICVSNFSTAMLDIPVPSSRSNDELGFEAFTERIPALGAPVRLILKPKLEKQGAEQRAAEKSHIQPAEK